MSGRLEYFRNHTLVSVRHISGESLVNDVHIECNSNDILVTLSAPNSFNGLSKNSSCMAEYRSTANITYKLPLRSCNTMSTDVDDGVEYFNTVVVQPHRRLVTNQGRGYHIRCRYQTREKRISNGFNVRRRSYIEEESDTPSLHFPTVRTFKLLNFIALWRMIDLKRSMIEI
ncbi:unnamed protein product [Oppiella nova]|uniref:ZP domain-containing protein n=1 Tax=Oppiella nova TaxID=334625 RepID=A0A7R9LFL9_9ACAR|nr:unnamed protein product [Oppiella nova]CAG2163183.1 unnamed protein product [Oppiella nova]